MSIPIPLVYVLSGYITITATSRELPETCTECKKQHINSMNQLINSFKLAVLPPLQHVKEGFPDM